MDSKWTIGFITAGTQDDLLRQGIDSVRREAPDAQLIVVGGEGYDVDLHVPFDESKKAQWITRKKNIITGHAMHDNICYMHDYVALEPGWLDGFKEYGDDWLTCMTKVKNQNGVRYRDWCVIYNDAWMDPPIDKITPPENSPPGRVMNYDTRGHERWQYMSGAYFCAKKQVMIEVPLDEERVQSQGEDVQHSRFLYARFGESVFQMNTLSSVKFLKQKEHAPWEYLPRL